MATVVAPKTAANTCSKSRAPVAKRVPLQPCYSAGRHHRCGRRAPNYAEARGAESRADFVHKMAPRDYEMFVAFTGMNCRDYRGKHGTFAHCDGFDPDRARSNISAAPSDEN